MKLTEEAYNIVISLLDMKRYELIKKGLEGTEDEYTKGLREDYIKKIESAFQEVTAIGIY
jgi:hypothetical protein